MRSLLLLPLLGACGDSLTAEEVWASVPPLRGCMVPEDGWIEGNLGGLSASVSGLVRASEVGVSETECFTHEATVGTLHASSSMSWFAVEDASDNAMWIVGLDIAGHGPVVELFDEVVVEYRFEPGEFGPDVGALTVTTPDGDLLAWVGEAGSVGGLTRPAELGLAVGEVAYERREDCGHWEGANLDFELGGESASLWWGEEAVLGGYRAISGGVAYSTATEGCPDWFVAHALGAVVVN